MFLFHLSVVMKGKNNRKIKLDESDTMQGVDEGGPTSQFISEFCKQLGDLYVMLPIGTDVKGQKNIIDVSRYELEKTDFLQPQRGDKVIYDGRKATVKKYYSRNIDELDTADLSFNVGEEEVFQIKRNDFEVKEVAIKLFDQQPSGFVPQRDDFFRNAYDKVKSYLPKTNPDRLQDKAKLYYRAVGRFLLHVMSDGRNPIPSSAMPEIFRNGEFVPWIIFFEFIITHSFQFYLVLLRNCSPGTADYPDELVLEHMLRSGIDGLKNAEKYFGIEFEDIGIGKEGQITNENFIGEFIPRYVIEPRCNNLKALCDGLTLEGMWVFIQ